jgi:hypothetical protein
MCRKATHMGPFAPFRFYTNAAHRAGGEIDIRLSYKDIQVAWCHSSACGDRSRRRPSGCQRIPTYMKKSKAAADQPIGIVIATGNVAPSNPRVKAYFWCELPAAGAEEAEK